MSHPRWIWLSAAALLVTIGTAGSALGASVVAHNDAQRSHEAFVTSSAGIASTLKAGIQQENSLLISAEASGADRLGPGFRIGVPRADDVKLVRIRRRTHVRSLCYTRRR